MENATMECQICLRNRADCRCKEHFEISLPEGLMEVGERIFADVRQTMCCGCILRDPTTGEVLAFVVNGCLTMNRGVGGRRLLLKTERRKIGDILEEEI